MSFQQILNDGLRVANSVTNWNEPHFSWEKAYVASVFSRAAYEHIPEFEIKNAERAKLIPCEEYRDIFDNKSFKESRQFFQSQDMAKFLVIERDLIVVVIAKIQNVLFIALRGTQNLHDMRIDFDLRRVHVPPDKRSLVQFHRGFFEAVSSCIKEVVATVYERLGFDDNNNVAPLYITGHSLGGAMAAIMNIQLLDMSPWLHWRSYLSNMCLWPTACYTFGMPRYGNRYAVSQLATPYHVYNEADLVPTLPPRIFGFFDSPDEYCLTSSGKILRPHEKGSCGIRRTAGKLSLLGANEHNMECYLERIERVYRKVGRQPMEAN